MLKEQTPDFNVTVVRPATVCGYAPRQRLDVIVNILTNHAFNNRKITIFGGEQRRPNITVKDMVRSYIHLLNVPIEKVKEKFTTLGLKNHTVNELANMVKKILEKMC